MPSFAVLLRSALLVAPSLILLACDPELSPPRTGDYTGYLLARTQQAVRAHGEPEAGNPAFVWEIRAEGEGSATVSLRVAVSGKHGLAIRASFLGDREYQFE